MADKKFDRTVQKMCRKRITDPDEDILGERFSVEQAIAAAVIRKAMSGATDSVKLIREILDNSEQGCGELRVDINVVD
ncbi:MAG: hypothetical protein IJ408_01665 [Clostridia bacterium]|nr:hypothetical protein [Clostridia bacterium]